MATRQQNDAQHSPAWGPLWAFLTSIAVALLIRKTDLSWGLVAVLAASGVIASLVRHVRLNHPVSTFMYQAGVWSFAAMWTVYTIIAGWSAISVTILIGATIAAMVIGAAFAPDAPVAEYVDDPTNPHRPGSPEEGMAYLVNKYAQIPKNETVVIQPITAWANNNGWRCEGEWPAWSMKTLDTLQGGQLNLAASLKLDEGCTVEVSMGSHQGAFVINWMRVNVLAQEIPYPTDYSVLSVANPMDIGRFATGDPTLIDVYQADTVINGRKGSGKTVLEESITASLLRCTEPIVCHVDMNGGGIATDWMAPYAEGLIPKDKPPIGWVAPTVEEALVMTYVLTLIAKDRKIRYRKLMRDRGMDVLPVDAGVPPIYVIVDEGGELMGEDADKLGQVASKKLRELQRIGRSVHVHVIFSVQRATGDYIPPQMKKNCEQFVTGQVTGEEELSYLFGWSAKGISDSDLTSKGMYYIKGPLTGNNPRLFKGYRIMPPQMVEIAIATYPRRVDFDKAALTIGGDLLARRFERITPWLQGLAGYEPEEQDPPYDYTKIINKLVYDEDDEDDGGGGNDLPKISAGAIDPAGKASLDRATRFLKETNPGKSRPAHAAPEAGAEPTPSQAGTSRPGVAGDDLAELEAIAALGEFTGPRPNEPADQHDAPARPAPASPQHTGQGEALVPGRRLVRELMRKHKRMTTKDIRLACIAAGHDVQRRQTLKDWLNKEQEAGYIRSIPGEWAMWEWTGPND